MIERINAKGRPKKMPHCKHCGFDGHTSFLCLKRKRKVIEAKKKLKASKPMKKIGKVTKKWLETRDKWLEQNKAEYYVCHYCPTVMTRSQLTLDHYESRGRHPELRYSLKNLVPCCLTCNQAKGSLSGDEYIAKLKQQKERVTS